MHIPGASTSSTPPPSRKRDASHLEEAAQGVHEKDLFAQEDKVNDEDADLLKNILPEDETFEAGASYSNANMNISP